MVKMAQGTAFSRYLLDGVSETNYEIGRGSYAVVEELDYHGVSCVGKSIHRELYDNATVRAQERMLERFAVECELLSRIRHPHIVQFLGVYFTENAQGQISAPLPVIVMERLHCTLASTIERHGRLPQEISHPILREVAAGLAYLHARPVVHRDLSANNVLLATNMSAKISDLGVAKILDLSPARMVQMTTCPGTPSYMPPEALATGQANYSTKIDIFSYGNLMTHVLSGEWPMPSQAFRFEASNPGTPIPITEAERRDEYLRTIGEDHPLMTLIRQCLSNNPEVRPDAPEILRSLDERAPQQPPLFTDRVEALQRISERVAENQDQVRQHQQVVEEKEQEVEEKQREVNEKQREVEEKQRELEEKQRELETKEEQVRQLQGEVEEVRREKEEHLREKEQEIEQKQQQIDQLVFSHRVEVESAHRELTATKEELAATRSVRDAQKEAIAVRDSQLRAKDQELASKGRALAYKESTIAQLRSQASMSLLLNREFTIRWRCAHIMPGSMTYPHLVRINNDIYAGGGKSRTHEHTISKYNPVGDTWSILPKCPTTMFGLTELEGKPVLVGGTEAGVAPTSDVYTLEDSREWRKSLPPLPTARFNPTVFRYKSFLIACGGITSWTDSEHCTCTTAVEVFSSKRSQWYNAEPLPVALNAISYSIIDDTCYLIGGSRAGGVTNRAFCVSVQSLIQQAIAQAELRSPTATASSSQSSFFPPSAIWRELPRCPCYVSTAVCLGGCLLAIGGLLPGTSTTGSTLVHFYSPSTNSWVRLSNADIPDPRYLAAATRLTNGDIILIGGSVNPDELCNTAFIGSMEF